MLAKDVMTQGVLSISHSATLWEAAQLLAKTRVSAMPVVNDGGGLMGLISEADIIRHVEGGSASGLLSNIAGDARALPEFAHAMKRPVTGAMTKTVVFADENATLSEVANLMLQHKIKRVPIVRGDSIVGMVSRIDMLRAMTATDGPGWSGPSSGGWRTARGATG